MYFISPYHNPSVEEPPSCSPITQSNTSSPVRATLHDALPTRLSWVFPGPGWTHMRDIYKLLLCKRQTGNPLHSNEMRKPTNQSSRTHRWYQRQIMRPCQDLLHRMSPISNCQEFAIGGEWLSVISKCGWILIVHAVFWRKGVNNWNRASRTRHRLWGNVGVNVETTEARQLVGAYVLSNTYLHVLYVRKGEIWKPLILNMTACRDTLRHPIFPSWCLWIHVLIMNVGVTKAQSQLLKRSERVLLTCNAARLQPGKREFNVTNIKYTGWAVSYLPRNQGCPPIPGFLFVMETQNRQPLQQRQRSHHHHCHTHKRGYVIGRKQSCIYISAERPTYPLLPFSTKPSLLW